MKPRGICIARDPQGQGTGPCPPTYGLLSHTGQGHLHAALHLEHQGPKDQLSHLPATPLHPASTPSQPAPDPRPFLHLPRRADRALLTHHQQTAGALSPHHQCPDRPYPAHPVPSLPPQACAPCPDPHGHLCPAAQSRRSGKESGWLQCGAQFTIPKQPSPLISPPGNEGRIPSRCPASLSQPCSSLMFLPSPSLPFWRAVGHPWVVHWTCPDACSSVT